MNKENLTTLVAYTLVAAIIIATTYLLTAAVFLEWKPTTWPVGGRLLAVVLIVWLAAKASDGE
jgi:hypothetical protein